MSPSSVPPDEMGTRDHDEEFERLLHGSQPDGVGSPELTAFVDGLRTAFPTRTPARENDHIAAMIASAHLLADNGDPVARPVSNADAPVSQVSRLPKQRSAQMKDRNLGTLALKVFAPVTVLFTLFGGVAYAGGLPDPLQKSASNVAGWVGLTIDDGDQGDTQDAVEDGDSQGDATDPTQDATDENDQGGDAQDGDSQGDATQDGDSQGDSTPTTDSGSDGTDSQDDSADTTSNDGDNQGDSTPTTDSSGGGDSQD